MIDKPRSIFASMVLVMVTTTSTVADEEGAAGESERCINARSIRGADVIDGRRQTDEEGSVHRQYFYHAEATPQMRC